MARTGKRNAAGWTVANVVVVAYALFPVWWIAALSFKDPSTLTDGRLVPAKWTWDNYRGSSRRRSSPGRWSTRSASR